MALSVFDWLGALSATAFRWSVLAFVVINGLAIVAVVVTRDRTLVNRWTGRLLGANLLLAATGVGIPLVATVTRLAVAVVMPTSSGALPRMVPDEAAEALIPRR